MAGVRVAWERVAGVRALMSVVGARQHRARKVAEPAVVEPAVVGRLSQRGAACHCAAAAGAAEARAGRARA